MKGSEQHIRPESHSRKDARPLSEREAWPIRSAREFLERALNKRFVFVREEVNRREGGKLIALIFCDPNQETGIYQRLKLIRVVPDAVQGWKVDSVHEDRLTSEEARRVLTSSRTDTGPSDPTEMV